MIEARDGHQMLGQNHQLFVFYKNDANGPTIKRDFDCLSLKEPEVVELLKTGVKEKVKN